MSTVSFAIIGCGAIARKHVASIAACSDARLDAICDVSTERMDQITSLWQTESSSRGELKRFTDFRELIADPSVHVIVIAAVSGLHAEIAKEALMAQKHIILEKPIALSLRDVDELIRLASERKLHVQVCHQLRYRPLLRKIKELIMHGELGPIRGGAVHLRIHRSLDYYQSSAWRGTWTLDGGMLLNQGIHAIDLFQWYLGMPERLYGELYSIHPFKETEDLACAVMAFTNGAKGIIEANSITPPETLEQSVFLFGDNGSICIGGTHMDRVERWYIEGNSHAINDAQQLLMDKREHLYMYQAMVDAYMGKHAELISLSEARHALELIFAIYKSAAHGNVQSLPLDDFSTSDMKSWLNKNNSPNG